MADAAVAGAGLAWFSYYPLDDSAGGFYDVSTRNDASEWTTNSLLVPSQSTSQAPKLGCTGSLFFSPDLHEAVLADGEYSDWLYQEGATASPHEYCGGNDPPLVPAEPRGFQNLFKMEVPLVGSSVGYSLINATPVGTVPQEAVLQDTSSSLAQVLFSENAELVSGASSGMNLYEWSEGKLRLVNVLSGGESIEGRSVDYSGPGLSGEGAVPVGAGSYTHAMSEQGDRVFFTGGGDLYARINPEANQEAIGKVAAPECGANACTIQLDVSRVNARGGEGKFVAASANGMVVFFVDDAGNDLTSNTQPASGANLYEYNLETGSLVDLTPFPSSNVLGFSGMSESGSYLYFAAEGTLGLGASGARVGRPNLFVEHEGGLAFVASLEEGGPVLEKQDWLTPESNGYVSAEASPNGEFFAFSSARRLTGYDNVSPQGEDAVEEFLYSARSQEVSCVSCDPSEEPPVASATMQPSEPAMQGSGPGRLRRNVLNDGTVFFNSQDTLVARDQTPGVSNVYEYRGGQINLISSGTSSEGSYFYEAEPSGESVYFVTGQKLVPYDTGDGVSIYDARVGGGIVEKPGLEPCEDEVSCHGAVAQAPAISPIVTQTTQRGNVRGHGCAQGRRRTQVRGRFVCRPVHGGHAGRRHHRHRRHHGHRRRAHAGRRAAL